MKKVLSIVWLLFLTWLIVHGLAAGWTTSYVLAGFISGAVIFSATVVSLICLFREQS